MKYFVGFSVILNMILLAFVGTSAYLYATHKVSFVTPQPTMQSQKLTTSTKTINQTYNLPIATGSAQTPLALTITSIDRTTRINVGDKILSTKDNKAFLVVNTKMINNGSKPLQISASDYVLLSQANKLVAPLYKALQTTIAPYDSYESGMVFLIDNSQSAFTLTIGQNVKAVSVLPISL